MLFQSYIPGGPLADFVEDMWLYEDYRADHRRERIMPSGTFEMVFNLREDELRIYGGGDPETCRRFAGAVVSGPYTGSFMTDTQEEAAVLGVHFRPGGAWAVLGHSAAEFTNAHIDLELLWGGFAGALRQRLCETEERLDRFRLVEAALTARLSAAPPRSAAVHFGIGALLQSGGSANIRNIAEATDMSRRRFIETFSREVGLTPKVFARVLRFQNVLAASGGAATVDWAGLAISCGYFDQSHLIRDFVGFSGFSPSVYRTRNRRLTHAGIHMKRHHLPLADA